MNDGRKRVAASRAVGYVVFLADETAGTEVLKVEG